MLAIDPEKLNNVKQLALKQPLKPSTLIKILLSEILNMREKYTLKEILFMINHEFKMEIKYANFQRTLNRLKETEPSVTQQQNSLDTTIKVSKSFNISNIVNDAAELI